MFDVVKGKRLEAIEFEGSMSARDAERVFLTFEGGIILRLRASADPGSASWIVVSLGKKEGVGGGE